MIELDDRVAEFLTEARTFKEPEADGILWHEGEWGMHVAERNGTFDVARWDRGSTEAPRLTGATPAIVNTYLILQFGSTWRYSKGMGSLRTVTLETPAPPGYELVKEPNGFALIVPDDPPRRLGDMLSYEAVELGYALEVSLQDLIDFYKTPDPRSIFPERIR